MRRSVMPARVAPLLALGVTAWCLVRASSPAAADDVLRIAPGRVTFTMKTSGEWTGFGLRGERPLLARGGVVVYASDPRHTLLDERASSARGGMRGVNATSEALYEGARGGARYPSLQPDDDQDGRVDEDAWDRTDNDHDGQTDEDFAAIGDEMVVAIYATRGEGGVSVRQECYAWSLPHIDGMVASTVVVTNTGTRPVSHARIGIELEAGPGLAQGPAPRIEGLWRTSAKATAIVQRHVVFEDGDRGLAALCFVPRSALSTGATSAVAWEVVGDRGRVVVVSPDLGDLAPGASAGIHFALVALPSDDLKAARAIRDAHRTMVGDGTARFIPPPVSVTTRDDTTGEPDAPAAEPAAVADDMFWATSGRLQETLIVGSPNPFHDAMTIEYEIPSRVTDEDGVEHALPEGGQPVSVKVYNVAGRLVATLVDDEPHAPGKYRTGWVARNEEGNSVASGVYYVRLQIGRRSVTMRMVQLK